MGKRTPLAWKNLINDPRRLLLASAGVGFAAVLMFTQNGFRNALLDSPVQLIDVVDADLVAISPARYMLPINQRFSRDLLRRAAADPDVVAAGPLLVEMLLARVRVAGRPSRPIRVMAVPPLPPPTSPSSDNSAPGVDVARPWLRIEDLDSQRDALRRPGTALVDRSTRSAFGFEIPLAGQATDQVIELLGKRLQIVGSVQIGTDFANEGTLLVSESSFADYFSQIKKGRPLETADLGLIRVRDPAAIDAVAERLKSLAPQSWLIMTPEQLRTREQNFWSSQTPIGTIFFIGTVMGFAVGVIICYQILFTNLQDAMPEYATLKAMGYPNRYFVGLVVRQAIYLSVIGFIPAMAVATGLFWLLQQASGLPMWLTWDRAAWVLGLTTAMCLVSGLLAMRKLLSADPASLF